MNDNAALINRGQLPRNGDELRAMFQAPAFGDLPPGVSLGESTTRGACIKVF